MLHFVPVRFWWSKRQCWTFLSFFFCNILDIVIASPTIIDAVIIVNASSTQKVQREPKVTSKRRSPSLRNCGSTLSGDTRWRLGPGEAIRVARCHKREMWYQTWVDTSWHWRIHFWFILCWGFVQLSNCIVFCFYVDIHKVLLSLF